VCIFTDPSVRARIVNAPLDELLVSVPFVQAIKFIASTNTVFCSVYLVPSANLQVGMLLLFLLSRASADAGMVSMLPTVNPDLFKVDGHQNCQVLRWHLPDRDTGLKSCRVCILHMSACLLSASTLLWHCPLFALPLLMLVGDLCMLHCYMLSYILFYFDLQHATFHLFCLPLYLGLGGCTSSCYRLSHSCIPHMSACNIQLGTAVPLLAQITLSHCSAAQPASLAIMLPVHLSR